MHDHCFLTLSEISAQKYQLSANIIQRLETQDVFFIVIEHIFISYMFKTLYHSCDPGFWKKMLSFYQISCTLRSSYDMSRFVILLNQNKNGGRDFSSAGHTLWNGIPCLTYGNLRVLSFCWNIGTYSFIETFTSTFQ